MLAVLTALFLVGVSASHHEMVAAEDLIVDAEVSQQTNVSQQTEDDADLGLCCLKQTKQNTLTIEYLHAGTSAGKVDPNSDCDLTSVIPADSCDQQSDVEELIVWPGRMTGSDCDNACRADMERYSSYHSLVRMMAVAEKNKKAQERKVKQDNADQVHANKIAEINQACEATVAQAVTKASDAAQTTLSTMQQKTGSAVTALASTITGGTWKGADSENAKEAVGIAASSASDTVTAEVDALRGMVTAEIDTLDKVRKDSKIMCDGLIGEAHKQLEDVKNTLESEEEEETKLFEEREVDAKKGTKQITDEAKTAMCEDNDCCCTIKYQSSSDKTSVIDVKVSKKFIKWDACQFAEVAPKNGLFSLYSSKCDGFMTACNDCVKREQCPKHGCGALAKDTTDAMYPPKDQPAKEQ